MAPIKAATLTLGLTLLWLPPVHGIDGEQIRMLSVDFPHGATRLVLFRTGEATLYYGALPAHCTVRQGTFQIDELFRQLQPLLHANIPREQWPDPHATAGMLQVTFADGRRETYLLFDAHDIAERLFARARNNVVGPRRLPCRQEAGAHQRPTDG